MAEIKQTGLSGIQLGFFSGTFAKDPTALALLGVVGREELSRLFEYQLLLARIGEPLSEEELAGLVTDPCVIALGNRQGDIVHGILSEIEHVEGTREQRSYYVATLVPYTSLLTLGRRSAIYQETTVPELITTVLEGYGLAKGRDFEIRIARDAKSPKHEYIAQYNESDWDFLQRWMEREGWFYWFTHTKKGARLIIADENADTTSIDDPEHIPYREKNNLGTNAIATIWDFRLRQRRVQAKVSVVDYNHRKPRDLLMSTKKVDENGFGHVFHYGEHFKDQDVGDAWAQIRSEELYAERQVVSGVTDCSRFRVGHSFTLERHYIGSYDGSYLITSLEHRVGLDPAAILAASEFEDVASTARAYSARFKAIPMDVPFRPHRRTPWPRIDGVINGHIEADTSGDYAQIDGEGRYKVKLPFDFGTAKGLTSSRWIRMAQSYAGSGYGTHQPQHKGTEVLIAHIDGDPDRPVIVGAVPNAVTPGPVAKGNATQSVIMTASGMRIELEDQA